MKKPASKTVQRVEKAAAHDSAGVKQLKQAEAPSSGINFSVQRKKDGKAKQLKGKKKTKQLKKDEEKHH